ncbi:MAG TPA: hypothetical protein VGP36_02735 [Mycobacteriales bacterium]|nr:hypothetical protein [Mycobacteriales bacterium]
MSRILAVAAGIVGTSLVLLLGAPAAHADGVDDAVKGLQSASVYVAPGVTQPAIDTAAVIQAIGSQPIKIAVLNADDYGSQSKAFDASERIGKALAPNSPLTVGVIAGKFFNASSSTYCAGSASTVAKDAVDANKAELQSSNNVTTTVQAFVTGLQSRPVSGSEACRTSSAAGATDATDDSGGSSPWPWVAGIGAVGVIGAGGISAFAVSRRRRRLKELEGRRAEVLSLYDRLGADVQNLHGDDPVVRQALADAAERYTATGSQLSQADTHEEYDVARRTALEGLQAARTARKKLGLDPGPDLPPIAPAYGEQLTAPREVEAGGKSYQGYPEYTPGAPYYYGGGGGYPGGWYSFPFWQTVLLGSVLGGGFGGGWGGGGYGTGYDQGYEAGQDNAQDSGANGGGFGGGDWGGGGSGWTGGGGDWGGGGGGGDWGGGGGDSGGGSW